ncbi:hypothetical protein COO60DRAFT_1518022 [Scenedesmus sp. NREL 46B-D3]|nr:hypothetical protein COO60DRAFT_1518022 [Scenedesmus sp. NREL 46B-D3]
MLARSQCTRTPRSSRQVDARRFAAAADKAALRLQRLYAIEEKRDTAGSEANSSPDMMSQEQLAKLAELKRQRSEGAPQTSSNVVQGALEEAQLISWPTPGKALLDTVLVLAIVAATGALLFSLNVLLADVSNLWYSR